MNIRERLLEQFLKVGLVCTDTREIKKGAIFFGLKGENFDGSLYADKALDQGCSLAVVQSDEVIKRDDIIVVEDSLIALQNLALDYRKTLVIPIVGITGTNGKTTTKELLHSVLSSDLNCYATEGNYNNHIGVPLSILKINTEHEIAVIEMGASKIGDISELCEICLPTCGLITNVGQAHLEGFGSFENIKKTKKELYDFLGSRGSIVFMNSDNSSLKEMGENLNNISHYSISGKSPLHAEVTNHDITLKFKWTMEGYSSPEIKTNLTGKYNLENALAAIAVGTHFGIPENRINSSIEGYTPRNNRSQIKRTDKNTLILDAYNANITSTKESLLNLSGMSFSKDSKFFILGDMLELGDLSIGAHKEMIAFTKELGLNGVFVGKEYSEAKGGSAVRCYINTQELLNDNDTLNLIDKVILIKGSRGIKLEVLEDKL